MTLVALKCHWGNEPPHSVYLAVCLYYFTVFILYNLAYWLQYLNNKLIYLLMSGIFFFFFFFFRVTRIIVTACFRPCSWWANIRLHAAAVRMESNTLPSVTAPWLQCCSHLYVRQLPGIWFRISSWPVCVFYTPTNSYLYSTGVCIAL